MSEEIAVGFVLPSGGGGIGIGQTLFEMGTREIMPAEGTSRSDEGGVTASLRVVDMSTLTLSTDGVSGVATKWISVTGDGFVVEADECFALEATVGGIGKNGSTCSVGSGSLLAPLIISASDRRGVVGIGDGGKLSGRSVGIGGDDTAGPYTSSKDTVWGIGIGWSMIVGVVFLEKMTGRFIENPGCDIWGTSFVTPSREGDALTVRIVGVGNGIGGATFADDAVAEIVGCINGVSEGVGDGGKASKGVVLVGGDIAGGVGDGDELTAFIVVRSGSVSTAIGSSERAVETIIIGGGAYEGGGDMGDG